MHHPPEFGSRHRKRQRRPAVLDAQGLRQGEAHGVLIGNGGARVQRKRAGRHGRDLLDEPASRLRTYASPFRAPSEAPRAEFHISLEAHEGGIRGQGPESALPLAAENRFVLGYPSEAKAERRTFRPPAERAAHRVVILVGSEDGGEKTRPVRKRRHRPAFGEREVSAVRFR